jgi:hypothetical protein
MGPNQPTVNWYVAFYRDEALTQLRSAYWFTDVVNPCYQPPATATDTPTPPPATPTPELTATPSATPTATETPPGGQNFETATPTLTQTPTVTATATPVTQGPVTTNEDVTDEPAAPKLFLPLLRA